MQNRLKIYNTANRKIEDFLPINEKVLGLYTCGPTVYHYAHLGNMRAYVFADILNNTLRELYPEAVINHVINITDVGHNVGDSDDAEDKMEKGSKREGKNIWDMAKFYTDAFMQDLESLNIDTDKYIFPRATDYIPEQIELVKKLEEKNYTYKTSDGIYFDTSKYAAYADFAKLNVEGLEAGKRVADENDEKKNKTDFALWKFSPSVESGEKRQMEWESPWGIGFPGWHIECSAMSGALLGTTFDIHTGGIDHIPVHHTNEIAQSVCAHSGIHENAKQNNFVNYWMHNNFLNDSTGKMSKSNEEFMRLQSIIDKGYNPAAYRYLLLTANYRKEIDFSYESLDSAAAALLKLQKYMHEAAKDVENIIDATKFRINKNIYDNFLSAMCEDLNTSKGLAVVWELISSKEEKHKYSTILKMNKILGLDLSYSKDEKELDIETKKITDELFSKRKIARENKDWKTSDELRDQIKSYGLEVID
jgi:cysteinyl-tRNA synthetase